MNSYLDLIKEYNRVHYKKNRITILCIVIAVSLVNTIFGMADMSVRSQIQSQINNNGNFHVMFKDIDETVAKRIGSRPDVEVAGWIQTISAGKLQGKRLAIAAAQQGISKQMNLFAEQGRFPNGSNEAMLDQQAMEQFSISLDQMIKVNLADGSERDYKIVGVYGDFSNLKANDSHGLFLSYDAGKSIVSENDRSEYYVQFKKHVNVRKAIVQIKDSLELSDSQISENNVLLGLMGQSEDNFMIQLYMTAAVLFVLVLIAGVVMIAGNFNMSVMQRIQFFGLLRCLGASKAQVKRFVLLEGIRLSLKAIPIGLLIGTAVVWGLSAFLKCYNATYFGDMPLFQLSGAAIVVGALVGFLTAILASLSPCKKASIVSPLSAINGNVNTANVPQAKKAIGLKNMKVETAIGISHCFANKKNMLLMSASFAISIILFLAFSVMVTFMYQALKPLKPYSPDISISAQQGTTINRNLLEQINKIPDIKRVYGRMFAYDVPVITRYGNEKMMLISYEQNQFNWAKQMLAKGKLNEVENGDSVLVVYNEDLKWELADKIKLDETGKELNIAGILSNCPFDRQPGTQIVICSEKTFANLMQTSGYTIIDMQLDKAANDQTVSSIRALVDSSFNIYDRRQSNIEARAMFYSMAIFIYGFLMVIALITVLNIINNMNSSVAIRLNYYGIMMAVGMSIKQIRKMIVVEAATYAICGCLLGCILAMPIHKFLFESLITYKWAIAWTLPVQSLMIIISITIITTLTAVIWPVKKISEMDIVKVVNAA